MDSKSAQSGSKVFNLAVLVASTLMALLYLYTAYFGQLPSFQQRGILLAFCYILALVKYPMLVGRKRRAPWTIAVDVLLGAVTVLGVQRLIAIELQADIGFYYNPTAYDLALGAGIVVSTLEIARRTIGLSLTGLAIVCILYAVLGHNLSGIFRHLPIEFSMLIRYLTFSMDGIFGVPLAVATTIVVIFMLFANLITRSGVLQFFMDFATGLTGRYRGGPAKIAVVASAFEATMSGSGVANVAGSGSISIPMMKRLGYDPNFAGAVEATASTGGAITPPVMGAAAFIIAEYLGIPYWQVCLAALLPALLYFISVYMGVDLVAMKLGLRGLPREKLPSVRRTLLHEGYMLLPVVVLVYLLEEQGSAMLAGFWAIVTIILVSLIKKENHQDLPRFGLNVVEGLAGGVKDSIMLTGTAACAGIVVGVLMVTGLSTRVGSLLLALSGGNLALLLLLCAVLALILGMGMTTVSVYLLVAIVMAPAIIKLGVLPLAAHLFVFYFANLSHITPPVCVAVFVACGISGGKIFPTAWHAMKLGLVLFIYPFFFAYQPNLILQGNVLSIVAAVIVSTVAVIGLSFAIYGQWWWGKVRPLSRLLFGLGSLALIFPATVTLLVGIVALFAASTYQFYLRKAETQFALQEKAGG